MFKSAFAHGNRRFSCALMGLFILMLITLGMFAAVMRQGYLVEREWRAEYDELREQWQSWQAQGILNYTVRYSASNNYFTCRGETLTVQSGMITQIPLCAQSTTTYYSSYERVTSVSEAYSMLNDWMTYNQGQPIEVEYHPDLHYITRAEFEYWTGTVAFEFSDLQVME